MNRSVSANSGTKRSSSGSSRGVLRSLSGNGLIVDDKLTGIFKGFKVAVLGSKTVSSKRKAIIEQAVTDLGGETIAIKQVSTLLCCQGQGSSARVERIIVRDGSMEDSKLLALLGLEKLSCSACEKIHVALVEPDIIQDCVKSKKLPAACTTPVAEKQSNRLLWGQAADQEAHELKEDDHSKKRRSCSGAAGSDQRSNQSIVAALSRLSEHMQYVGDEYRSRAYGKARDAVARHEGLIRRVDLHKQTVISQDAQGNQFQVSIRGVGKSSLKQIKEYLEEGSSFLLRTLDESTRLPIIKELMLVWGVGYATAITLQRIHNISSWRELRDKARAIPTAFPRPAAVPMMLTFLDYFEELHEQDPASGEYSLKRVPRAEIAQIADLVQAEIRAMPGIPLRVHCCGSYRRGKKDSGDIDIVLEAEGGLGFEFRLDAVVDRLQDRGVVRHLVRPSDLAFWHDIHRAGRAQGEFGRFPSIKSYMGFVRLSPQQCWRRIDMWLFADPPTVLYGILQFTGSKHFNCSMRLFAKRKGLVLNSTGLYHGMRGRGDGKLVAGEPVAGSREARCEADVFRLLGLHYVEPADRDGGHPTMTWGGVRGARSESWQAFGEDDSEASDEQW